MKIKENFDSLYEKGKYIEKLLEENKNATKYKAKIKYNGNHRFAGDEVEGYYQEENGEHYIFDIKVQSEDMPWYGEGFNRWEEIDVDSLEEITSTTTKPLQEFMISREEELAKQNEQLKQELEPLKLLLEWATECDFGLDNIINEDEVDIEKFDKDTENMGYTESIIHYAKMYLEKEDE
jgi:hypothetical protein